MSDSALRAQPGYIVDSILPPGEALRRFRVGLDSPATLNGPRSRDELVNRFIKELRPGNGAALARLAVNRAEFAFLVYPQSRWTRPPYRQAPDIVWMLSQANSDAGMERLVERVRGADIQGYRCDEPAEVDGPLRLWPNCVVRVREGARTRNLRVFGSIVERDGRYKFLGYSTSF